MVGGYCPKKGASTLFLLGHVSRQLDRKMASYDHILILGDF